MAIENLEGTADKVVSSVQSSAGKVVGDGGTQAEGMARETEGQAREIYGNAKDAFDKAASAVSNAIGDGYTKGSELTQRGLGGATETVRATPVLSLLAAAAFGYVLALALHR